MSWNSKKTFSPQSFEKMWKWFLVCIHTKLGGKPHWPGSPSLLASYMGSELEVSVQFSCSVLSDSLQPHGLQHSSLPYISQLPELAQTHVHRVSDAIQLSCSLSSSSPPDFNLFQHQGLFQWVNSSHQVTKVLEFHLQHQSFQWIFRTDLL